MNPLASPSLRICVLTGLLLSTRSHAGFNATSGDWQDTANWASAKIDGTIDNNGTAIFDPDTYKTGVTAAMGASNEIKVGGVPDGSGASTLKIASGTFGNSAIVLGTNIGNKKAVFEVSGGTVVFGDAVLAGGGADVAWTQTGGSTTIGTGEARTYLAYGGKNAMSFSGASRLTIDITGDLFAADIVNGNRSDLTMTFSDNSSFTTTGPAGYGMNTDRQGGNSVWHFEGSGVTTSVNHGWSAYAGTTFRFTADSGGVSPVNITTTVENFNRLNLGSNASALLVDISAYKPFGNIPLFTYPYLTGTFAKVAVTHGDRTLSPLEGIFTTAEDLPAGQYYLSYGANEITLYYNSGSGKSK